MFLLIDNYDSFTYNLVQAFQTLGHDPLVVRNDDPRLPSLIQDPELDMVCISPGPGHPRHAGRCMEMLALLDATAPHIPVLGVCLGHQVLGLYGGAEVRVGPVIMHGKASDIEHDGSGLFSGLPNPLTVGRYHSLVVGDEDLDQRPFRVTARGPQGEIMALAYTDRPWVGVQFHPESVLTPDGLRLLGNFPQGVLPHGDSADRVRHVLECLAKGEDLPAAVAADAFSALMDGAMTPAQAGSFLMGLRMKGESPVELAQAARAALARAVRVPHSGGPSIDVVGTGGDGRSSFNCSTATALTLAGMGYRVLKHGNRAVSSPCGSADAVEELGLPLEMDAAQVDRQVQDTNFAFLFAPRFHPAFRHVAPLRKDLGLRTLFNLLGPLINPACPSHLLLGVARPELLPLLAETLRQSPVQRAAVVHGAGGYDEITPLGDNRMLLIDNTGRGEINEMVLNPREFGIPPCSPEDLAVPDRATAVAVLRRLLRGEGPEAMRHMLTLNVGMALYLLEEKLSLRTCMAKALEAVAGGAGRRLLHAA